MEGKMQNRHQNTIGPDPHPEDYITIIGQDMKAVMRQFHDQGLDRQGYAITGRIDRHRFEMADADGVRDLFEGTPMLAATFMRRVAA
jgi:hypothetical protein